MAEKTIIWSDRAVSELKSILDFYIERNGSSTYSLKILDKTDKLLEAVKQNDLIGRLTTNKRSRVVVLDEYLIFYEVQNNQIEILSFWDNRQNPMKRIDQ